MDWIVFGDDWGGHVSTTQHLILNLPPTDRVVWIDSIGMRSPRGDDLNRVIQKIRRMTPQAKVSDHGHYQGTVGQVIPIAPRVIPWHLNGAMAALNAKIIGRAVKKASIQAGLVDPVLLTANPIVAAYLDVLPTHRVGYLRLDAYAEYPGVDPALVYRSEPLLMRTADIIFSTAKPLLPEPPFSHKGVHLPQGVHWSHFAKVPLTPSTGRTVGFYGLISRYINFELVEKVAHRMSDWTFEFIGRHAVTPPVSLTDMANVHFRPAVPFAELPELLSGWQAAWAPYGLDDHTRSSDPLKIREYLAAGLPSHCTPIPAAIPVPGVFIGGSAATICQWLEEIVVQDNVKMRSQRRAGVSGEDWSVRSGVLRDRMSPTCEIVE